MPEGLKKKRIEPKKVLPSAKLDLNRILKEGIITDARYREKSIAIPREFFERLAEQDYGEDPANERMPLIKKINGKWALLPGEERKAALQKMLHELMQQEEARISHMEAPEEQDEGIMFTRRIDPKKLRKKQD